MNSDMIRQTHWDNVFSSKATTQLTWHQPHLRLSLELLADLAVPRDAPIIDVGAGDSSLVDDLLDLGYTNLTLLDVSALALERSRARLGERAARVAWIEGDITQVDLPAAAYLVWHDRATFHFLVDPLERGLYILAARKSLAPGGYMILSTFALDGPETCSGLPVTRYSPESLARELGSRFTLLKSIAEGHHTPWGGEQRFQYSLFQHGPVTSDADRPAHGSPAG